MSQAVKSQPPTVRAVAVVIPLSDPRHSRHKEWLAEQERAAKQAEDK
jgi:hypothetical protein